MDEASLAATLASVLGARQVHSVTRLSGGASRETWRFVAVARDGGERELVLQRQRRGSERDLGLEAEVLRAARAAGVPVAQVVVVGTTDDPLGAPFMVLAFVPGETIARKILRDDEFAGARRLLTGQLGRALGALHRLPVEAVPGLVESDQLLQYRQILDELGEAHPAFELAFRWLAARRPPAPDPVVVHGDFRLGNVIVGADGLRAVVDWELAHLGDPMEDLGWLCVRAWRFGGSKPVAGLGDYDELFTAYSSVAGHPVDPQVVRWWEVVGTLKWGIMCMMQARAHLSGLTRSHELAAIGRRVCENELDLLDLLAEPRP